MSRVVLRGSRVTTHRHALGEHAVPIRCPVSDHAGAPAQLTAAVAATVPPFLTPLSFSKPCPWSRHPHAHITRTVTQPHLPTRPAGEPAPARRPGVCTVHVRVPHTGCKGGAFQPLTAGSVLDLISLDKTKPVSPDVTPFFFPGRFARVLLSVSVTCPRLWTLCLDCSCFSASVPSFLIFHT